MSQLVNHRWFALAEFLITLICGIVLLFSPTIGGWIVLIAFVPLILRITSGHLTYGKIYYTVLLVIFLTAVGIGIWSAYNRQAAWGKFWVILASVALYFAIINQPRANWGTIAGLLGILGVIIAITFTVSNDWSSQSSDLELIDRAGEWFTAHFQVNLGFSLPPNIAGGLLAMIAPIPIALSIAGWQLKDFSQITFGAIVTLVILIGLLLTSSRGAWLALIAALLVWLLWRLSVFLSTIIMRSPQTIFLLSLLLILLPVIIFTMLYPSGFLSVADSVRGLPSGASRIELAENTTKLIQDFPFTGGGLRSFPGLYSQYIMVTPFFLFAYSHNFYLDLILELGWVGALGLFMLFVISLIGLLRVLDSNRENSLQILISEAVLVGFIIVLLHGLVDDPLFGERGSPLLLLMPGFAILLTDSFQRSSTNLDQSVREERSRNLSFKLHNLILPGSLVLVLLVVSFLFQDVMVSSLYANLGAVFMAQSELQDWPSNKWNDGEFIHGIEIAEERFVKSIALDENQRTAWHRLGLIAMHTQNYNEAELYLEKAYNIDPEHRGIRKSLGYTYVWVGNYKGAAEVLEDISEAKSELETYSWWWREHDREDLARRAEEMIGVLSSSG